MYNSDKTVFSAMGKYMSKCKRHSFSD